MRDMHGNVAARQETQRVADGSLWHNRKTIKFGGGDMMQTQTQTMAFLYERAQDAQRALTADERETIALAHDALRHADTCVIRLGGKAGRLGECIVETALLEGVLQALRTVGKADTPVHIVVDAGVAELFDERLYQEYYWPEITCSAAAFDQMLEPDDLTAYAMQGRNMLLLDLHGEHDGIPYMEMKESEQGAAHNITTLAHLARVGLRSYAQRGPERRYAAFVEDLFGLPAVTINSALAQPCIRLSLAEQARYSSLAQALHLRPSAMLIVCFFQSVVAAKCYERWDEVMQRICEHVAQDVAAQQPIDFLIACGPDEQQLNGLKRADMETAFADFTGANGNARVLAELTPSLHDLAILLTHAALTLANDTGPGHLAGALGIPTITPYLPGNVYSKSVWASSLWHHGVTLAPNPFSFQQIEAAVLWNKTDIINSIPSEWLADEAICCLSDAVTRR